MRTKSLLIWSALTLGLAPLMTAPLVLAAHADQAISGMDRSGMKMAQQPAASPLSVRATINPAAPKSGDNTLDLMVSDAMGKPVTGLKLTASVAITSMDMGTTHPAFTETGSGHYKATVNFSMDGPWRVIVRGRGVKVAVLDFEPGSKAPWKSPQIKAIGTPSAAPVPAIKAPAPSAMAGMDKSGGKANAQSAGQPDSMAGMKMNASGGPDKAAKTGSAPDANALPGMDMGGKTDGMAGMSAMKTGIADMKTATVPELQEKGTYTATGHEDWKLQAGFGHNAAMVGMMNQMMVGGSGMEGMKMPAMHMKFDEKNYAKPEGDDATGTGDMAGMDMGGKNSGMKINTPTPASAAPSASLPQTVTAAIDAPKAGDNILQVTVTDAQGRPLTGAKITASVAMASMDMGTTHPAVTEKGGGQYTATANFSMAGPWQVKVKVTAPGQKPVLKAFDFTAK